MSRIWRQKGLLSMSDIRRLSALQISWDAVSRYLEALLAALLGRPFTCTTKGEDDNYWSVAAVCDSFTNVEIVRLVHFVEGSDKMLRDSLPIDTNTSKSLDMSLCRALLKYALKLDWSTEFVSDDALVILGNFPPNVELPSVNQNLISIDSKVIDCRELIPMERFIDKLFEGWGMFSTLTEVCEEYESEYGTPLYWMHPFTDGRYNGCYFVLVQEGVLVISYDEIDGVDHEVFVRESGRLCDAIEMRCFLNDWNQRVEDMTATLTALLAFLERKEAQHGT